MRMENFFKVMNGEMDLYTFEQWLYETPEIEGLFSPDNYLELISMNYKGRYARYELIKLLTKITNQGEFETYKLIRLMEIIIAKSPGWHLALDQCDTLSHHGYIFLRDLEEFAHLLSAEPYIRFGIPASVDALSNEQKDEVLEFIYPGAAENAEKVLNWLKDGKIIITGEVIEEYLWDEYVYIDNR